MSARMKVFAFTGVAVLLFGAAVGIVVMSNRAVDTGPGGGPTTLAETVYGELPPPDAVGPRGNPLVTAYMDPGCGCCGDWARHVEAHGFDVDIKYVDYPTMVAVKERNGIGNRLASCHTAFVGGYFVEGHVPADLIRRMLDEQPGIAGIAVPGMPVGSPGMEQGPYKEDYDVLAVGADGTTRVYARR